MPTWLPAWPITGWDQDEPVIGLSFDGTGYGTDGAIWGGEVLVGGYAGLPAPLPPGLCAPAGRRPGRAQASPHGPGAPVAGRDRVGAGSAAGAGTYATRNGRSCAAQLERRLNAPLTSSMGRLFDAASALIGVRQNATYEGQAAIELEALADPDGNRVLSI